jgi:hypothetical protein
MAKQGKRVAEEIVAGLLRRLSQWLSHHVMLSKVNAAYLKSFGVGWSCSTLASGKRGKFLI